MRGQPLDELRAERFPQRARGNLCQQLLSHSYRPRGRPQSTDVVRASCSELGGSRRELVRPWRGGSTRRWAGLGIGDHQRRRRLRRRAPAASSRVTAHCGYWTNTVVLVVWDDWGGWYDHVLPWRCTAAPNGTCSGYDNGQQGVGGEYVYGFRVPLLVVSAYTGTYQNGNWSGYISGACGSSPLPPCPNKQQPYVHDFGSILNFIEYAFGQNGQSIAPPGGIYPTYPYADYFAPDGPAVCEPTICPYSLSDFFNFSGGPTTSHPLLHRRA